MVQPAESDLLVGILIFATTHMICAHTHCHNTYNQNHPRKYKCVCV